MTRREKPPRRSRRRRRCRIGGASQLLLIRGTLECVREMYARPTIWEIRLGLMTVAATRWNIFAKLIKTDTAFAGSQWRIIAGVTRVRRNSL